MNVLAAFFHRSGDGNNLEVSRVDVGFRLVRVTYRGLRQAANGTQQHGGLYVIRVNVGADSTEQIVPWPQTKDVACASDRSQSFVARGELRGPVGGKGGSGRRVFEDAALWHRLCCRLGILRRGRG